MVDVRTRAVIVVAAAAVVGIGAWLILRPHDARKDALIGYVVSDDVYMTSPVAGTVGQVLVKRGQRVEAGQPLFSIDPTVRAAAADRARAGVAASEAQAAQRTAALGRAEANLAAAQAEAERAADELARLTRARTENAGAVAAVEIERARAAQAAAAGRRDAARTEAAGARAAIEAARAGVNEARAGLTAARRELGDLSPVAPRPGRVTEVMYKPGESIGAGAVVVAITPDDEVKVRFYAPEGQVAQFQPGRRVSVGCDGCASGLTATVDYVADRPEFTPPIIYSLQQRAKLVFMVEAAPARPQGLSPGQPVDVTPVDVTPAGVTG